MSIVVAGLNYKSASIELLERLAIPTDDLGKALHQLATCEHVVEGAVLSTCNRVEVYAVVSKFHGGAQDLRNFLAEFCHVAPEDFSDRLYTYHDDAAVRQLFRVAAGIDSMVVGESEILGQVRRAYQRGVEEGLIGRALGAAFRNALRVGKRSRTETTIGRNPVSVSAAAVELARRAFTGETLTGKKVAIVGAGKMGRLAARALANAGARDVTVVNRGEERGVALAEAFDAVPRPMSDLGEVMAESDIVISSTTSPGAIIDRQLAEEALAERRAVRPLFVVDIAVPRDVDPSVAELPGVILRDIDDLRGVVDANVGGRLAQVSKVEAIVAEETERFMAWERAAELAPKVADLVAQADAIRREQLEKMSGQLRSLTPQQREAVEQLTRKIVAKLLHAPVARAKELDGSNQGSQYLAALRDLFRLDDEP